MHGGAFQAIALSGRFQLPLRRDLGRPDSVAYPRVLHHVLQFGHAIPMRVGTASAALTFVVA
jgi:hypothetical protein